MTTPRVDVDLSKIRFNTGVIVRRLKQRGVSVTGVTKAFCGHPAIAQAMLDGGASGLADSRMSNVRRLRAAGMTGAITLIRTPILSQAKQVVQHCEESLNTEVAVITALAAAAVQLKRVHGVILMLEMGDGREGVSPTTLANIARQITNMSGVTLSGIGANFACLSDAGPTNAQMAALSRLATEIENVCGKPLKIVSGGNSSNLQWALNVPAAGRVNNLRVGEAILLGVDPVTGNQIRGMHTDAFTLVAEVIEAETKSVAPVVALVDPAIAILRLVPKQRDTTRLILALGKQDTDIEGLIMPFAHDLIGATSDHLVIGTESAAFEVGSEVKFQMNYSALMHAMAAPDVETALIHESPSTYSRHAQRSHAHLALH
ncbi:alanine racemase [Falsihalocynthiibacter sp. SS001]|uniref:alanine racemase n=1 Tax=Falsihalocynthiibacter sp. SS001 TaxID=3349698 RepID=UPI0036D39AFF